MLLVKAWRPQEKNTVSYAARPPAYMSEWCESRDADTEKGMRFNMTQAKSPTIPKEREEGRRGGGLVGLQPVDMLVKKQLDVGELLPIRNHLLWPG